VPADFYSLWLDRRMVYSCAYFAAGEDDLDEAQARKLEYLCRKLRLVPGERLLDIGCGWGGLLIHAAQRYGVEAVGVTLSAPQAEEARRRIRAAGFEGRCRVEVADYRELPGADRYDKIVSVGMVEHVGLARLPAYFRQAFRLLRPGGAFLNHGITSAAGASRRRRSPFIQRYVFPDGELVPIAKVLEAAEDSGFETRDVESLREHYVLTLRHWVRRLEARREAARRIVDEATYRVWRLYMAGSAHAFRSGAINVYQSLLVKSANGASGMPLTREGWYDSRGGVVTAPRTSSPIS
jgi:cyclopropane-fatty-acyl-phospholipid synthase